MAVDDSYTVSLLHFDGADNSIYFVDESGKIWTRVGDTHIHTGEKHFGLASGYFDGVGDYVGTPASTDFNFGTGDFTVDCWCYVASTARAGRIVSKEWETLSVGNRSFRVAYGTDNKISFVNLQNSYTEYKTSNTFSTSTWFHVMVSRQGAYLYLAINGTVTTHNVGVGYSINDSTGHLQIGTYLSGADENYNGYIDELRISKGIARWTDNFTPQTRAYSPPGVYLHSRRDRLNMKGVSTQNQLA